ncbi:MAG: sirohydrochlorin cobaltochelatase [Bryobacteraceae bacterium]|nr:hypothetical protein [Bryobacterales bacterium]MEB2360455.1 hypothetical protein [Bryobacterales bacterium]NUN02058.1 sirohydrochlorin cobaltochelatase [Bryobacteraceae bacterium]
MKTGLVVFAHGSRIESANESVRITAAALAREGSYELVEAAFLELGTPDLAKAIGILVKQGANRIAVIPYFLTPGLHVDEDLPRIVDGISRIYNGVKIYVTAPLDGHPALVRVLLDRAREAVESFRGGE